MTLSRTEERAEMALFMAQHPISYCVCTLGFMFCLHDRSDCPAKPPPFLNVADIIDQLIERGRIVR